MVADAAAFMVDLLIKHPQVAPLTALVVLAAYHLKWGVIHDLQQDVRGLREKIDGMAVITYRLAKKDPDTDADAVRDRLWDNGRSFPDDFDSNGRYVGYTNENGTAESHSDEHADRPYDD